MSSSTPHLPRRLAVLFALALTLTPCLLSASPTFERPVPPGGGPTVIECAVAVLDLDDISDANQSFTINVYAVQRWHDPREAHPGPGKVSKPIAEVWHPHLIFWNKQRTWNSLGGDVEIGPDGEMVFRQQLWGDFSQPMNLHDFPFDSQDFEIRVVEAGPEEYGDLALVESEEAASIMVETYSVPDWKVTDHRVSTEPLTLSTGDRIDSFTFIFTAKRLSNHYIIKVIAPMLMIIILSWVVFWLDPAEGGSQLGVSVTAFLTVIAYHVALGSKLPEIPYLTRLDVFVFGATLLVFLAMIEVVITTGLARTERVKAARWLDRACRVVFPGILALVSLYAFAWR